MTLLQTNAAINSGNSGGGLFNLAGELIGVVNAKYAASGVEGLGFAIPVDTAAVSIAHLLEKGYIPGLPALGCTMVEKTVTFRDYTRRTLPCVVNAGNTSLRTDDLLWSVNGVEVGVLPGSDTSSLDTLQRVLRGNHSVGETVTLVIYRLEGTEYRQTTVSVTLTEYVPAN